MTNVGDTTEDKKTNDRDFDNMEVGSYLKERLASSSKSSSDSSQESKEERHSSYETQKDEKNNESDKNNKSDKITDKNTSDAKSSNRDTSETDIKGTTLEPTISTLVLSLSSAALIALGLATDPSQDMKEPKIDKPMAKFNIDMLIMLKKKTKGNLTSHEQKLIEAIISDLQIRYVEVN